MVSIGRTLIAATGIVTFSFAAQAADPRCSAPPYGGTEAGFKAFVDTFGKTLENPSRVLATICDFKFGGKDRTPLYNLGFTDADINAKETSALAVDMLAAVRKR